MVIYDDNVMRPDFVVDGAAAQHLLQFTIRSRGVRRITP